MAILSDKPFKEKQRDSLIDKKSATESIKERLNAPRKKVKFTWEGLKKAHPLFETSVFSSRKLQRIIELT